MNAPPWLVELLGGISVWDAVVWLAGLAALAWFVKHRGWRGVVAFARGIINSAELLAAVQGLPEYIKRADERHVRLETKVDGIYHETHNNDGSSVKDSVDRIEGALKVEVIPTLAKLSQADDDLWAAIDEAQGEDT
ncbi:MULTISPECIES: hypothetical protein [unclassified Microbacterium]|uniref:hypothetical protein n=1 Tax=unclassified Microbacterium TaxID=2609290 RepID=UPI00301764C6